MRIPRLISLTAESSYPIMGALGRPAQAWFLGQVTRANPGLASTLHDEKGLKPYTVSTLLDDNGRPLAPGSWLKPGQIGALGIGHPAADLGAVIVEAVEPVDGIGGGGDPHRAFIQNCSGLSVSSGWPRSFHANRATTPGSGS